MEPLLCQPSSPIFRLIGSFLDSGAWYVAAGLVAAAVAAHTAFALLAGDGSVEGAATYEVVAVGCALANAAAFLSYRPQVLALVGENGLAPAARVLRRLRHLPFRKAPCAFRGLRRELSDRALLAACDVGLACSLGLALALPTLRRTQLGAAARAAALIAAPILWLTMGVSYLSLLAVSGDFLGLQSDSNLVEVDALLALLSLLAPGHPQVAVTALRFFAFRKMLGCGVCKYYGSPMWRDFTALQVHYFTQPLVNPRSVRAHLQPRVLHRFSVLATFLVEVVLPFLAWAPRPLRLAAWTGFNGLNAMINLSGNYGFIGFLNTMENLSLTDDRLWSALPPAVAAPWVAPLPLRALLAALLSAYFLLSLLPLAQAA